MVPGGTQFSLEGEFKSTERTMSFREGDAHWLQGAKDIKLCSVGRKGF